jgi:hypothetical protein
MEGFESVVNALEKLSNNEDSTRLKSAKENLISRFLQPASGPELNPEEPENIESD